MDTQGKPLGSSNQGVKNTSDPSAHHNPKQENPGPIASDSLAAESFRAGGAFGENKNSEPQLVKGSSSTFAITDTSNATTLAPAPYAAEREAKAAWQETSDELRGSGGQKYPEGAVEHETKREPYKTNNKSSEQETTSENKDASEQETTSENKHSSEQETTSDSYNPSTKPTAAASKETEDPDTGDINATNPTRSQISTNNNNDNQDPLSAPSAFAPQPATSKPKGTNITEGGFDDDDNPDHDASFTAEIGTENDPGRLAEATFRPRGADIPGPGKGSRQTDVTADGQYDVLQSEQEL